MDSDSCKREQKERDTQEQNDGPKQHRMARNRNSNGGNVFPSTWIRRSISKPNEINRFLLDYGFYFLLPFSTILYTTLFFFS